MIQIVIVNLMKILNFKQKYTQFMPGSYVYV